MSKADRVNNVADVDGSFWKKLAAADAAVTVLVGMDRVAIRQPICRSSAGSVSTD